MLNILLVEDNHSIRGSLTEFLTDLGHHVLPCCNGVEAIQILDQKSVHLVLSDIRMPCMDGYQLLKTIKQHKSLQKIEVILFTGHGDAEGEAEARRMGVYDYLHKPIDVKKLSFILNDLTEFMTVNNRQIARH